MQMGPLETTRLIIRPFRPDDLEAVDRLFAGDGTSEAERKRWLTWADLNHEQLARLWQPPYGDRAVVDKTSGVLIGSAGLVPSLMPFDLLPGWPDGAGDPAHWRNSPEVGLYYHVAEDRRGQGIATEAAQALVDFGFETLRLARIVGTTEHDNLASQAVMRKLGMTLLINPQPEPAWLQVVGVLEN